MNLNEEEFLAMDRYLVKGIKSGSAFLGEGAFSMVWKATDIQTKREVALKNYKEGKGEQNKSLIELKFARQIDVMKYLEVPLSKDDVLEKNPELWHDQFKTESCFSLKLLDYSQDVNGRPAPHSDGQCYVITELAEYSLMDLMQSKSRAKEKFTDDEIQFIASSCILCVAGLHAKNLVHLDFKSENIVMCEGKWRLIDLDGAVPIKRELAWDDQTVSFTPPYCAPEFAKFMSGTHEYMVIEPSMDVWSVGLVLCELVTLKRVISQENRRLLLAQSLNSGPAIIDWLIHKCKKGPLKLPPAIQEFSPDYVEALHKILIGEPVRRAPLAKMMEIPYFEEGLKLCSSKLFKEVKLQRSKHIVKHEANFRLSTVFKGMLRKLNSDGDPTRRDDWRKRDFWITANGALCYFSGKETKPMVLIDRDDLRCATSRVVDDCENLAYSPVFEIQLIKGHDVEAVWLAANSAEELDSWMEAISNEHNTFNHADMCAMRLTIRNQRGEVDKDQVDKEQKVLQSQLWKLSQDGDPTHEDDWRLRDMWLTQDGSLCYDSTKFKKPLVYHAASDMRRAVAQKIDCTGSCKQHAFTLILPPMDGMEYEPSVFAALDEHVLDRWIDQISKLKAQWISKLNVTTCPLLPSTDDSTTASLATLMTAPSIAKDLPKQGAPCDEGDGSSQKKILTAFRKFDTDGNGFITIDELTRVLRSNGMSQEDIAILFDAVDTNHDGKIDYDEFVSWIFKPNKTANS